MERPVVLQPEGRSGAAGAAAALARALDEQYKRADQVRGRVADFSERVSLKGAC